jgi:hypothetical protein
VARSKGAAVSGNGKNAEDWSSENKFAVAKLNDSGWPDKPEEIAALTSGEQRHICDGARQVTLAEKVQTVESRH